jgi:hypothetical protein
MVQGVKASARKQDRKNSQHQQIKTKNPVVAIRKIHRGKRGIEKGNYPETFLGLSIFMLFVPARCSLTSVC